MNIDNILLRYFKISSSFLSFALGYFLFLFMYRSTWTFNELAHYLYLFFLFFFIFLSIWKKGNIYLILSFFAGGIIYFICFTQPTLNKFNQYNENTLKNLYQLKFFKNLKNQVQNIDRKEKEEFLKLIKLYNGEILNKIDQELILTVDGHPNAYTIKNGVIEIFYSFQDSKSFFNRQKSPFFFDKYKDDLIVSTQNDDLFVIKKNNKVVKLDLSAHHWHFLDKSRNEILVLTYAYPELEKYKYLFKENFLKTCEYTNSVFKGRVRLDTLTILDANKYNIKKVINIFEIIIKHPYLSKLIRHCGDLFHMNSVYVLKKEDTRNIDNSSEGDLLISLRELEAVILLDRSTFQVKFYLSKLFDEQHWAIINSNGNIVLFDNKGAYNHGQSRILEFDPSTKELLGSFAGTREHDFDSKTRGQVIDLGNNEYLINSSLDKKIYHIKCKNQIDHKCVSSLILEANNDIAHINIFKRN